MLDLHDKRQDLPARPDTGFLTNASVTEKIADCLSGLWRVKVVLWENGQMQKINGFDIKPPPEPGLFPDDAEPDDIAQLIYQCAHYMSEREGRRVNCKALFYQREEEHEELREVNPSGQIQFHVLAKSVENKDDEEPAPDAQIGAGAVAADVLNAVTPIMNAVVNPMIKGLTQREQVVHKLMSDVQTQQQNLNTVLLNELSKAYENQQKTSRAIIGARESELESRRIATEMFTEGIRMRGQIMNERQEMIERAHEAEITRLKDEKRHSERMDMIKEFGPAFMEFIPDVAKNLSEAFAKGRIKAAGEVPTSTTPPQTKASTHPAAPPQATSPIPPPPTPSTQPSRPVEPMCQKLQRFGELMTQEMWAGLEREYNPEQVHVLRSLCALRSDKMIPGAFAQLYAALPPDEMEKLPSHLTEEQGDIFTEVAEHVTRAFKASKSAQATRPPPPAGPAPVIEMAHRRPPPPPPNDVVQARPIEEPSAAIPDQPTTENVETKRGKKTTKRGKKTTKKT
jgi:hypothetical protein